MNISKMRTSISIYEKVNAKNSLGETTKELKKIKSNIKAEKRRLKSSRFFSGEKESISDYYRFIVRYREDITESMVLEHRGKKYNIISINNISDINKYETHIDCELKKAGVSDEL